MFASLGCGTCPLPPPPHAANKLAMGMRRLSECIRGSYARASRCRQYFERKSLERVLEAPDNLVLALQRLRPFAVRSRAAACLRRGADFFAEPFRATGALAWRTGLTTAWRFVAVRRFSLACLSDFFAAVVALTALATLCGFAEAPMIAVTFSTLLEGVDFAVFRTSLPGTAAGVGGVAVATGTEATAFVLPFGRPPFRANCASASILRKASCASAIN